MEDPKGNKVHLNSKLTLGEDMADAGGIAQAFRAWKDRYEEDPVGDKYRNFLLPGLSFTREQMFWLAYGRGWARSLKVSFDLAASWSSLMYGDAGQRSDQEDLHRSP